MSKISKYFSRDEFACNCSCGFQTADVELINVLEDIREHFEKPVIITSGCRCVEYNDAIQRKYNPDYVRFSSLSKHLEGIAADFIVYGVDEEIVADYLEEKYPNKYGIGRYEGRTHVDVREIKARWRG